MQHLKSEFESVHFSVVLLSKQFEKIYKQTYHQEMAATLVWTQKPVFHHLELICFAAKLVSNIEKKYSNILKRQVEHFLPSTVCFLSCSLISLSCQAKQNIWMNCLY